jgi:hypothetical protein
MTITYPSGTVLNAFVVSNDDHELRAVAAGCEDVLAFTRINGTWISEAIDPVTIEFEWQDRTAVHVLSEDDFICPKELARQLIHSMRIVGERSEAAANDFFAFGLARTRAAIHRS